MRRAAVVEPLLVVLVLAGCKGAAGPQGPAGTSAPPSSGKRLVWVDATGAEVGPAEAPASGTATGYVDAQGLMWPLDPETARAGEPEANGGVLYDNPGCTGAAYINARPVRVVFKLEGETALRVRPDTLQSKKLATTFSLAGSTCTALTSNPPVVDLAPTSPAGPLQVPALAFSPPLHQELR